jgi:hypothetical protein
MLAIFKRAPNFPTQKQKKVLTNDALSVIILLALSESNTWGYSSAGRALEWHSRGQRFDPAYLHQFDQKSHGFFGQIFIKN